MENILFGTSTQNRSGKYLYYGGYDTDDISSLISGEIGIFWGRKSSGPGADTGAYTGGGSNDDATALGGSNVDIADTPNVVTESDMFYFVQGIGNSKAKIGLPITTKHLNFKVLEYIAPVKRVQTITIAAASIVAGKTIKFDLISKSADQYVSGSLKMKQLDYTISTATATAVGADLKTLIEGSGFYTKWLYSVSEAHSSDVVVTITWKAGIVGTAINNTTATATSVVAEGTAFTRGHGTGAELVEFEKQISVREGYNPSEMATNLYDRAFSASSSSNYHVVAITSRNENQDVLGSKNTPVEITQYIAIDTSDTNMVLLEEIVSLLTDMVEKRAVNGAS